MDDEESLLQRDLAMVLEELTRQGEVSSQGDPAPEAAAAAAPPSAASSVGGVGGAARPAEVNRHKSVIQVTGSITANSCTPAAQAAKGPLPALATAAGERPPCGSPAAANHRPPVISPPMGRPSVSPVSANDHCSPSIFHFLFFVFVILLFSGFLFHFWQCFSFFFFFSFFIVFFFSFFNFRFSIFVYIFLIF